jgi:tetratricopeptide (TPR) repeat protein
MRCRSCDAELPEAAAFCPKCGARQADGVGLETIDRLIADYRRRLDDQPEDADARFNLALAYKHKGLDDLALGELERLRAQGEEFADLECEAAALYERRGDRDQAVQALQRALTIEPEHDAARRRLRELERHAGPNTPTGRGAT